MAKFSGRLRRAPIVYALCQVKFPTVGTIDEGLAEAVHGPLRADYPYRIAQDTSEIALSAPAPHLPAPVIRRSWLLFDRRKASGYVLDSTSVVYRTTAYSDFKHFVEQTIRGVAGVLESFKPPVIERIGVRFIDLVEANEKGDLHRFIEPALYGFTPHVTGFNPHVTQQLIRGKTPEGDLHFRYSRGKHGTSLPADLIDPSLVGLRTPQSNLESVIIDIDHFRADADLDPKLELVQKLIEDLQTPMSTLFKAAVTDFAIDQWNTP